MNSQHIDSLFSLLVGRLPSNAERVRFGAETPLVMANQLCASREHVHQLLSSAVDLHLYLLHGARVRIVATQIPSGRVLMDLGGANGNLHDMGYPHGFEKLIVVDLPPEHRHEWYRNIALAPRLTPQGPIVTVLANMTDLGSFEDSSADVIWSGQSIEHITEEESFLLYSEVRRVLRPGGYFCLDTPNRLVTEIHVGESGMIHPDHKIEYTPQHLQRNLRAAGFMIEAAFGVCEMVNTMSTRRFDYTDFICGAGVTTAVDSSYVQFYRCTKL